MVEASGAHQGLCIHLGCGRVETPGFTAELAESSEFLVHSVALDDASLERARKAIDAKVLAGRASVERLSVNPLPYLNDLARVIVVEDFAALAQLGLTKDEILRVTSPGGVLLVRENGNWIKTIKPVPKGMDEWTHPQHGADGNQVSTDSVLQLPASLRWQDGLPVVATFRAGTGAYVASGGRLFTVGTNELEDLSIPGTPFRDDGNIPPLYPQFLTARDAFSGIPLWKINLGSLYDGGAGNWQNSLPLAASEKRVYAAGKESLIIADAATGKVLVECKTKYTPVRILLLENVVVAAGWQKSARRNGDWVWLPKPGSDVTAGSVEAFEADSGKPLWSVSANVFKFVAANGMIYMQTMSGDPPAAEIVALDLKTGKERWRVSRQKLGAAGDLLLGSAGANFVTAIKATERTVSVLSPADGSERFQVPSPGTLLAEQGAVAPIQVVDGLLWLGGKKYDPETGTAKGNMPIPNYSSGCQQINLSHNTILGSGGLGELPDPSRKPAPATNTGKLFRPSCVMSWIPAYGMAFTAANPCACVPGAVFGFTAIGPGGKMPALEEFEKPRPIEKGPAFGPLDEAAADALNWPTFRHDPERDAATTAKLPENLKELWRTPVVKMGGDMLSNAWRSLGTPIISGPVIQDRVFVSAADLGQVVALDSASGKPVWTATLGSRITGPPTLYRGLCVIGCHDGWVYALRAKDGRLAWRTRVAPLEQRMVAFGRVESIWPAAGPVLVHNDVLYTTAGRSCEAEGGVALTALDPATGAMVWGKCIGPGPQRVNDTLALRDGLLAWHYLRFDPKNGALVSPAKLEEPPSVRNPLQGAMLDAAWTLIPNHRRAGNAYMIGDLFASQLAWNDKTVVSQTGSIPREKTATGKTSCRRRSRLAVHLAQRGDIAGRTRRSAGNDGERSALRRPHHRSEDAKVDGLLPRRVIGDRKETRRFPS